MEIAVIITLALLNGILAMSELAVLSAKKPRLDLASREGHAGARQALRLQEHPDVFLPTVQIGITLLGTVAAAFGGTSFIEPLRQRIASFEALAAFASPLAFLLVVGAITYLNLVLGELVPKRLALHSPERVGSFLAPMLLVLSKLLRPLVWVLGLSTRIVLRLLGVRGQKDHGITEEEIKHYLAEGTRAGVLDGQQENLVRRVLSLDERPSARLMRPRSDVVWLDLEATSEENLRRIRSCSHARFPVCRGSLDHPIGVIGTRELFCHTTAETGEFKGLTDELRPPLLLPEHLGGLEILERFKSCGTHLGLVVDEYGVVQGIVTANDLLEAIVGELAEEGGSDDELIIRREDGSLLLDGTLSVDLFFELIERPIPRLLQYHTLAGLVIEKMGHIPKAGDRFAYQGWTVEVVDMDRHRIDKVLLQKGDDSATPDSQTDGPAML